LCAHHVEIECLEIANVLRIELLGKRGKANQVTEKYGDEAALLLLLGGCCRG